MLVLTCNADCSIVTPLVSQLSWTHRLTILSQCKTRQERELYFPLVIQERYSTRELERQIKAGVYERVMLSPNVSAVRTQLEQQGRDPFGEGGLISVANDSLQPNYK